MGQFSLLLKAINIVISKSNMWQFMDGPCSTLPVRIINLSPCWRQSPWKGHFWNSNICNVRSTIQYRKCNIHQEDLGLYKTRPTTNLEAQSYHSSFEWKFNVQPTLWLEGNCLEFPLLVGCTMHSAQCLLLSRSIFRFSLIHWYSRVRKAILPSSSCKQPLHLKKHA